MIETDVERGSLPLADPFTTARRTREAAEVVFVRIDDGEHVGVGAATPSPRYGETPGTVEAVLPDLLAVVREADDPLALDRIEREMRRVVRGNPAARAAVSIAAHDRAAKHAGLPLYRLLGLDPTARVETSFTVGIDTTERMREKAEEAVQAGFGILKVKLGTGRDMAVIEEIREAAPGATIRVDANEAWTPREAVAAIEELVGLGVEFVEQPVPGEDVEGLRFVSERSALPIAADEAVATATDVPRLADRADIVNLKLMKSGGLREAVRAIHTARAHGLEVMLGCMPESNASIAAACHLAPLLDYADLDGSLLLASDPYAGVPMPDGVIDVRAVDRAGTGARPDG